jgi:hypothetical protein
MNVPLSDSDLQGLVRRLESRERWARILAFIAVAVCGTAWFLGASAAPDAQPRHETLAVSALTIWDDQGKVAVLSASDKTTGLFLYSENRQQESAVYSAEDCSGFALSKGIEKPDYPNLCPESMGRDSRSEEGPGNQANLRVARYGDINIGPVFIREATRSLWIQGRRNGQPDGHRVMLYAGTQPSEFPGSYGSGIRFVKAPSPGISGWQAEISGDRHVEALYARSYDENDDPIPQPQNPSDHGASVLLGDYSYVGSGHNRTAIMLADVLDPQLTVYDKRGRVRNVMGGSVQSPYIELRDSNGATVFRSAGPLDKEHRAILDDLQKLKRALDGLGTKK